MKGDHLFNAALGVGGALALGFAVGAAMFNQPPYPLCDVFAEWTAAATRSPDEGGPAVDAGAIGSEIAVAMRDRIKDPAGARMTGTNVLTFLCQIEESPADESPDEAAETAEE